MSDVFTAQVSSLFIYTHADIHTNIYIPSVKMHGWKREVDALISGISGLTLGLNLLRNTSGGEKVPNPLA